MDPESGFDEIADVVLKEDKIFKIVKANERHNHLKEEYEQIIDASGKIVAPGLIDVHVHFRDPGFIYKEDIHTGAAAAARGGFTTVVCMANTKPKIHDVETLQYVLEEGKKTGIRVLCCGAVSKDFGGQELTDMKALK